MALAFLPVGDIPLAFAYVSDIAFQADDRMAEFTKYVDRQWINNPNIPLPLWNCHHRDVRTSNAVEGWHHRLSRHVRIGHPNAWHLIEDMPKEQNYSALVFS